MYEALIQPLLEKGVGSVDNWFSGEEIQGLRKALLSHYNKDEFRLAGIGNQHKLQKETSIRNDRIHWLNVNTEMLFEQAFFKKIQDFVAYLNRTCFAGIRSFEFHYAVYEIGSFYKRHSDQFNNDDRRSFSMVLYLTESWKEEDAGELLIYTKDETIKLAPLPGRLVFFSSDIEHEVLKSNAQRLSLTGWLKTL